MQFTAVGWLQTMDQGRIVHSFMFGTKVFYTLRIFVFLGANVEM